MVNRGKKRVRPRTLKKLRDINWKAVIAAILVTLMAWFVWIYVSTKTNQAQLQRNLQTKQQELNTKLKELETQKTDSVELQKQLDDLKVQKQEVDKQLQAKKDAAKVYADSLTQAPQTVPKPAAALVTGCGDNSYANYIYMHESGCNLNSVNSIGCRGIGQACPGTKLPCGADYACQNAFFTNYALTRYGSWAQAYNFWLSNHYW